MGFSHKGICHKTIEPAQAAFCESLTMTSINAQGGLVASSCASVAPPVVNVNLLNGTVASTAQIPIPAFLACEHSGGIDLTLDYFGVALGFIAVIAASKAVINIFRGRVDVA